MSRESIPSTALCAVIPAFLLLIASTGLPAAERSRPLAPEIESEIRQQELVSVAVLSGTPAPFPDGKYRFTDLPAFLAVHGTDDELVPYDEIVRTFNKARGPKVLLTVEGGDHGSSASLDPPAGPSVLATITDFFAGYLRGDWFGDDAMSFADVTIYPELRLLQRIEERVPEFPLMHRVPPALLAFMRRMAALPYHERTLPPHWKG